jgi:hypothetical protein
MAPISGDADEVSGTGVSGTFGGGEAIEFSGAITASASAWGSFRHAFRGADGDKHHRQEKKRAFDRLMAARRQKERTLAAEAKRQREAAHTAFMAALAAQAADSLYLHTELEKMLAGLEDVHRGRLTQEDEEAAVLLLLAA